MGQLAGFVDFDPDKDIPSLRGKVVFITGGTAGLGKATMLALLKHEPAHIYFSGRNLEAANKLIAHAKDATSSASLSFVEMDLTSLASVKAAVAKCFTHDRLDILICNAGIMAAPPGLSKDGFEIQFATNHLGHAMLIQQLLPVLLRTTEMPDADVRVVCLTSTGWRGHPRAGINFDSLRTTQDGFMGSWMRYGQSKLANVIYAAELARRYPQIMSVSVHPGVIETGLVTNLPLMKKLLVYASTTLMGNNPISVEQGCCNELWCAAGAKRGDMVNGAFYMPIGVMSNDWFDKAAKSRELANKLWEWTEEVLAQY